MKMGFICPNLPGHINPLTALARHLQARDHEVVFLYSPSANGLPCVPGDKNEDLNSNRPEMSKLEGITKATRLCYNEGTKAYAKEAGLKTDLDHPSWVFSELAYITQIPKEFDFENPLLPPQFHHTGPFHDGKGRPKVDFPWDRLTGEPLIYASMGTIMNGRADVFRVIVAGVAKHKGTQLVLSIGDQLDPKQIGLVPSNAIIVKQAPQLELLKQTSVCISHAGLNTVLESLAQGVPQVAIPITFEQPGVATRIAAKKTGVTVPFAKLTSDRLSTLLGEVLHNAVYRENARKFQEIIAKTNGLSMDANSVVPVTRR
jgi:MGT family glycosyltransferase